MSKYKVDISGVDTSKLVSLTNEENNELFMKMSAGDCFAREDLIYGNLKLVLSILKRFNNKADNLDDLFQVGVIGLIKAIDNFDLSYGLKLSTYACPMIAGEMRRYLRDNNMLRVSRSLKDLAYRAISMQEYLTNKLGYTPTYEEIAKNLGENEIDVLVAIESTYEPVSIYTPIYNDGGDTIYLSDQLEDKKENINSWDISIYLKDAIDKLKAKERKILIDRYLMGKTQVEISEEIGISQAQVSRLEKDAIKNVKKLIK